MADNRITSIFGPYAKQLQALIDARADRFKTQFFPAYFDWGVPTMTLSYATAIGRSRIEAAASVVAHGAGAPLRSRAGLDLLEGKVAAIKVKRNMKEEDYRTYMTVQNLNIDDQQKKLTMLKLIWEDTMYCVDAVMDRLDIMCLQAISSGKITISKDTNPDGINPPVIDLLMPKNNRKSAKVKWTADNLQTMTPISEIEDVCDAAEDAGSSIAKILMPKALFRLVERSKETLDLLTAFNGINKGNLNMVTLDMLNAYLDANKYPPIELIDARKAIEKDGKLTSYSPWTDGNVSFIPDGKLGIIHNAYDIEQLQPVNGIAYATYNNALISKWSVNDPWAEYTQGVISAFPGVEAIDSIYILQTA